MDEIKELIKHDSSKIVKKVAMWIVAGIFTAFGGYLAKNLFDGYEHLKAKVQYVDSIKISMGYIYGYIKDQELRRAKWDSIRSKQPIPEMISTRDSKNDTTLISNPSKLKREIEK